MKNINAHGKRLVDSWIDEKRENWNEFFLENISRRKGLPVKSTDPATRCLNALLKDVPELNSDYKRETVWHYLQWRCREMCDWNGGDLDWEPPEDSFDEEADEALKEAEKLREELMRPRSDCPFGDPFTWWKSPPTHRYF